MTYSSFTLPQRTRLSKQKHFDYVFSNCRRRENRIVRVYVAPAKEDEGKSAFIASKKLGNAIIRNRHKRRLKELFRLMRDTLKNRDFILVAKPALVTETFQESQRLLWNVFKELNVIKGEVNNANDSNRMH